MRFRNSFVGLLVLLLFHLLPAQNPKTVDSYVFGNSLVHHIVKVIPTPSDEDSTPHWVYFLAREAGNSYSIAGNFAALPFIISQNQLPLENNWAFDSVPNGWDSFNTPFAQSDLDNVVFTPFNFVQFQPPTANYQFGDTFQTPITAADTLIDWVLTNKPGTPVYIYEGWPDMATYTNAMFPPTPAQWAAYQADAGFNSDFHDWFVELHDSLIARHPNACIKMIPTGPIISELLDRAPYNTMAIDSLYEDDAPHGRPSIYFLAGMINYMAMFEEPAPLSYQPPAQFIDPLIISRYDSLVQEIWTELNAFNLPGGASRVFCNAPVTAVEEAEVQVVFTLYPNPTQDVFRVRTSLPAGSLVVRDLFGRALLESGLEEAVETGNLGRGLYLVELRDASGEIKGIQKLMVRP